MIRDLISLEIMHDKILNDPTYKKLEHPED